MMTKRNIIFSSLFIILVTVGLSLFGGVAYIYSLCGIAALITVGHFVTLDDDMPGEWSNMEGSKEIWSQSKIQLSIKCLVFVVLLVLTLAFPGLAKYGA